MTNETNQAEFNLDALLDGTLDDLADVPGFQTFPAGAHKVTINWRKVDKKPAYSLTMTAIETVELADSSDTPLFPTPCPVLCLCWTMNTASLLSVRLLQHLAKRLVLARIGKSWRSLRVQKFLQLQSNGTTRERLQATLTLFRWQ